MTRYIFLLFIVLLNINTAFSSTEKPIGINCELSSPPNNAGEDILHGSVIKVFPRLININKSYTGCQLMWGLIKQEWLLISVSEIINGDPVRLWSPHETDADRLSCTYSKGALVKGTKSKCPIPEMLLVKSLERGCVKRSKEVGRLADGCKYE